MIVNVNGKDRVIPSDLSQITLGQYIEFYDTFGAQLDEDLRNIDDYYTVNEHYNYEEEVEETEDLKRIKLDGHTANCASKWFTFWSGCDFEEWKDSVDFIPVVYQYELIRGLIEASLATEHSFPLSIGWNGEQWAIQNYCIDPESNMTFEEFRCSMELRRQLASIGKTKWHALPYLCCIFLRKVGERYADELVNEDGERFKLMLELPMSEALKVSFFLKSCMHTYLTTSHYSKVEEVETVQQS